MKKLVSVSMITIVLASSVLLSNAACFHAWMTDRTVESNRHAFVDDDRRVKMCTADQVTITQQCVKCGETKTSTYLTNHSHPNCNQ